ncbi:2-phosphosulfolactate phosphatase [Microbacterium sp. SORGH_AS_0888]|uniref:2-phosphosulfolactate phosphatase n=1 Tax=Microbacterium sp. SORGH_AS_0888 TaxID=3041791 RepID=UPI00278AF008|nr:2-phosphosulfolactate phosphatase [Microbacterium sp. SORGH_AS_0888]MDQ1129390.1 2-phosphosulfolactate phosphatase [Microbacterium sp. SORGH_AS_0888]
MPSAFDQSRYQVRLEWGAEGLARLAPADVVVLVDVLTETTVLTDAAARGEAVPAPASLAAAIAAAGEALVLAGSLRNASAVARAALAEQHRRGARTSIAIVPLGEQGRVTVEDQFGAGAVIDALAAIGIDHTSPESAAASEAFRGLRRALRHLLTASGSGQALLDAGRRDEVLAAAEIDAAHVVPVLRDGVFVAD